MHTLCKQQKKLSHAIAREFITKMYYLEDYDMNIENIELYFIWDDPTGTLWYWNEFWSLSDMYETLLHNYNKQDVWNYYDYNMHGWEDSSGRMNLKSFVWLYHDYEWDLAELYEKVVKERKDNAKYWASGKGKAESEKYMKEKTDEFTKKYLDNGANSI